MTKVKIIVLITMFSTMLLAGCYSGAKIETVGDRIMLESSETEDLSKQWSDGDDFIKKGKEKRKEGMELIKKGQQLVKEGNNKIVEGDVLVIKGKNMTSESELLYKKRFPNGKAIIKRQE